jgi:hypothetical protein
MPESATPAPLHFSASFPCEARFHQAVADLAVKVAVSMGYPHAEAQEFGASIQRAFAQAVEQGGEPGLVRVEVALRPGGEALDAVVRCSKGVLLELTRLRGH